MTTELEEFRRMQAELASLAQCPMKLSLEPQAAVYLGVCMLAELMEHDLTPTTRAFCEVTLVAIRHYFAGKPAVLDFLRQSGAQFIDGT